MSQALIDDQIVVLNNTFAGGEGGVDTGFRFTLAGVTRTVNADWYYANPGGKERAMKRALYVPGNNVLNMYLTTAGDYLGWAYLPKIVTQGNVFLDGVVIDWESLRGASDRYRDRYDQGETATHEVGHWLNLEHTFYRGCNGRGDYVDDTPYEATPTSGCPAGKDTCTAPGLDPIHNYMDYSYDQCYTEFTAGQAARGQDAWADVPRSVGDSRSGPASARSPLPSLPIRAAGSSAGLQEPRPRDLEGIANRRPPPARR